MNGINEVLGRVQRGQSDRAIAHDLHLFRVTVRKYREAFADLDAEGTERQLRELGTQDRRPGQTVSTMTPYQSTVGASPRARR